MTSRRAFKHYDERVSRMLQFIPGHVGGRVASAQPVLRRGGTLRGPAIGAAGAPPTEVYYSKLWGISGPNAEDFEEFNPPGYYYTIVNITWPYGDMPTKASMMTVAISPIVIVFTPSGGSSIDITGITTGPSGWTGVFDIPASNPTGVIGAHYTSSHPYYPLQPVAIDSLLVESVAGTPP